LGTMGRDKTSTDWYSKTFSLPKDVTTLAVSLVFNRIDSWDGASFYVDVNGQNMIKRSVNFQLEPSASDKCQSGWTDERIPLSFFLDLG